MTQELVIKRTTAMPLINLKKRISILILTCLLFVCSFTALSQTVVSNETFPNQFNAGFTSSNNSNGTFVGSSGTWTSSVNSTSLAAIAVIPAYYSSVTNAIKIVHWNTTGKGAAESHAASPTVDLSSYGCSPNLNLSFKLYSYTCSSSDPNSFFKVEFSTNNGSSWTSVLSMSSAQIYAAYGNSGLTTLNVDIPSAYRVSGFKYRFSGYKPAGESHNFYLFVDDAKINASSCTTCNGAITSLYFNELNNGPDLPITNGSTFTVSQLGSLYNMEAGTSGTIGSIKFTITGPTSSTNIENAVPYNSPGTSSGAWTGAVGAYTVNMKVYSGSDATGTLCSESNISFTLTQTPATGSIGDKVWFDANGNGIQDAAETIGLSGVTVKLRNSSNTVIATTTTSSSGAYLFSGLAAGTYTVEFPTSTASYILSAAYVGTNRDVDSDPSTSTGITPTITLSAGQNIVNIDAGYAPDCSCTNSTSNLLTNGSFENGTTGWTLSGGNLTTGTGYVMCGAKNGFLNWSSGTAKMYQDITVVAGSTVNFTAYAGTHTPGISCSPKLSLIFLNSSNAVISQSDVTVTKDVTTTGSNLDLYSISGVAPTGTVKVRVQASITCNTMKVDAFCLTVVAPLSNTNPDFNSTFINVTVPGNVSTNDNVPAGTTYGTSPTLVSSPAGSTPVLTMNSNGTYSFVTDKAGVYTYNVPVCLPGQLAPCPPTKLVITVLDANLNTNAPVANVDIATTKINTAVVLKTLANDAAGNLTTALVPSSVTITAAPMNGTTSINATTGDITYTPNAGFTGKDTLTYQVCDNQSPAKCATAQQIITVISATAPNTTAASDDYATTNINTPVSGNVKTNDTDPEGNTQTVTAQTTTVPGKGTLVLATNGTYTFTPVNGFTGPVDFAYTTCDNGSPVACASATIHILVRPELPSTNPDFNSTFINVTVPGNVSTNDNVPAGTTYGTSPTLVSSPAGSTPVLTMNSNGTYSFVTDKAGVYTYNVPVCLPGQLAPCPPTKLVITVLDANLNTNAPVANVDIATTKINTAVVLKTLANDAAGNLTTALVPSSVTITAAPMNGITSINATTGDITYTPNAGFTGKDTLTYQVCDNQSPAKCATAQQIITVISATAPNTTAAADDYATTNINTPVSGNVKTNDTDPEGNTQTVTAQTTTVAGKGTLVLATDGSYTFTPVIGFTGPVDFAYTTCDNGSPVACASATLHILVRPAVPATNPDFNSTFINVTVPGNVSTNDNVPAGTTYGTSPTLVSSPAGSTPVLTMNSNGTYNFTTDKAGVYTYNVPVCLPGQLAPCPPTKLVITVLDANLNTNAPVANVDVATTRVNTAVVLKTLANDAAGNLTTALVPSSVTITAAPMNGITSINATTGDITYTPNAGFTGKDTLTYQVCDNQSPAKCATAQQIITVKPATAPNSTEAADDYKTTSINTSATGNVKTNDTDPEGNTQTVTAQTTTLAGKGTLILSSDGSYTFIPVTNYTGPVDFPYTTCDNGTPVACATATLHILVRPEVPSTNPDFNSTFINVLVPGNVNTNDKVPAGTTYGTSPTLLSSPSGSTPVLTMNPNGTYSFVTDKPGVYTYDVPVCLPGQAMPCPPTKLVITVLNPNVNNNAPVANTDIATTNVNTTVVLKTLANDAAGNANTSLVPSSVTITAAPLNGTAIVNPANGDITYTPNAGYTGTDILTYQVCDNQSPAKCATAQQVITIRPASAANTTAAADDYNTTNINTPVSGNVKTNDSDPEGHTQTVTAQTTTVAGKGTLVLASNGTYTFTPVSGFTGPVDFVYSTCDNGTPVACASATLHILVRPELPATNPDFNSTFVNVTVPGNASTNDKVPAGTTYGTSPTLVSSPAGSTPVLTMNSNGTYNFTSDKPGVYTYNVPVCLPGQVAPCPPTKLVITVLDANVNTNAPVANVDIATTNLNTSVTLRTLANDAAGNSANALVPSSVSITFAASNGTTSINPATGDITYTPNTGFFGKDTLTYQVCDNQSPAKCATAQQIITVNPANATNTTVAADDYNTTKINTPVSGNVKTNDTDPEGHTQTVTAQTTTVAGKGTLVLASNGTYTFTPVSGFTGPVDFVYTTCDNGTPIACASATLHILVRPEVPVTNPDFNSTFVNVTVPGNVSTNDKVPAGTTYGTSPTLVSSPAGSTPVLTMNSNGTYNFTSDKPGVYTYNVPVCLPGQVAPCPPTKLVITVLDANVNTNAPVANVDIATTNLNTSVTLRTLANDAAGNSANALVPSSVSITFAASNGTTSINPATGDITYTPNTGFFGKDTLTYQVCDNQSPAKCATAQQIITVNPANATNTTVAADDYNTTKINTPVSGNVKTNDTDPEGHTQTVTAQTTTVAGKGTLVLASNGTYTFTPVSGFTGPVDFIYTTCDNGTPVACATATLHILVRPEVPVTNPDFNSTFVNVTVPGNVSTNDKVPAGTTYGTSPTLVSSPAGSTPVLTMNSNGTYNFTSDKPGVYTYNVPVCLPGQLAPCPPTKLVITVLDATINSNAPVANTDIATTNLNTSVTLRTLANDAAGNSANVLVPSTVSITAAASNGTTSINPTTGDITYTPFTGFVGKDTLTYQVCDNQSPAKCATALQIITVNPANATNTTVAADDYNTTNINTPVSGNVKTNDTDPEGNTQTVTAQTTSVPGKGTLVLAADGSYTFTPVTGYTGPVDFPYTTCDNGAPVACASATLHILIMPIPLYPDLTPSIFNDGTTLIQNTSRDNVLRIFNIGAGATNGAIIFTVPKMLPAFEITINPTGTFMDVFGGLTVANSNWTIVEQSTRYVFTSKAGVVIPAGGFADVGVNVKAIGIKGSTGNLGVRIVFGTGGGETPINNNADNNTYSTN